ncbi:MAG: aldo/keto reductase [Clostridia bacterium]|nr:aldo/keto reductase [Clostridia bacterium]
MIYRDFQDKKLSLLGLGAMRLPVLPDSNGKIDEAQVEEMVRIAMENGVNYYDTAYPYHGGQSEPVMGRVLKKYPRESFYLATKFPGHQFSESYDPAKTFEHQLERCQVDYFDFYLLHNVCEKSMDTYFDERWGIIDYFIEQKKQGRIRHLGFSSHARPDTLKDFLDKVGEHMEFCQIQLNYLDWSLQDAKAKYDILTERGIPVWVMEPLRGGKLANLPDAAVKKLGDADAAASAHELAFRYLADLPNVKMILSGMSNIAQMQDNIGIFAERRPLEEKHYEALYNVAEGLKKSVPCTACRYCCDGCPAGLDIPLLLSIYNDYSFDPSVITSMAIEAMPEDKRPASCIGCGACESICPQGIEIPKILAKFADEMKDKPTWEDVCSEREAAMQKMLRGE